MLLFFCCFSAGIIQSQNIINPDKLLSDYLEDSANDKSAYLNSYSSEQICKYLSHIAIEPVHFHHEDTILQKLSMLKHLRLFCPVKEYYWGIVFYRNALTRLIKEKKYEYIHIVFNELSIIHYLLEDTATAEEYFNTVLSLKYPGSHLMINQDYQLEYAVIFYLSQEYSKSLSFISTNNLDNETQNTPFQTLTNLIRFLNLSILSPNENITRNIDNLHETIINSETSYTKAMQMYLLAKHYKTMGNFPLAKEFLLNSLEVVFNLDIGSYRYRLLEILTDIYEKEGAQHHAIRVLTEYEKNVRPSNIFIYELNDTYLKLWELYDYLNQTSKSFDFYRQYTENDELINEFEKETEAFLLKNRYQLINDFSIGNKEERILQFQIGRGKLFIILLFGSLTGVIFISIVFYLRIHQKRIKEKNKAIEIKHDIIRSQIDNRFLEDSLKTITKIHRNSYTEDVGHSMSVFSEVIRYILEYAKKPSVVLKDEIQFMANYLDNFNHIMHYRLSFGFQDTKHLGDKFYIPPMLLQSFLDHIISYIAHDTQLFLSVNVSVSLGEDYIHYVLEERIQRKYNDEYFPFTIPKSFYLKKTYPIINERIRLLRKNEYKGIRYHISRRSKEDSIVRFIFLIPKIEEEIKNEEKE